MISLTVFALISMLIAALIYQVGFFELQTLLSDSTNPKAIVVLKLVQTVSTIGTFILPAFLIAYLFDRRPLRYLSLDKKANPFSIALLVVALIAALPLINYLGELNSRMSLPSFLSGLENWMKEAEEQAAELTKSFLDMNSFGDVLFNIFMMGILPALGEELLFRGIIQKLFSQWSKNIHVGVWVSAILFSAMHLQFYGFIPRMLLGVLLGYLLVWSGSLWLPIVAHFVNNASAVLFTYLFNQQAISMDADTIGTQNDYTSVLVSAFLTGVLLWLIYKREKNYKIKAAVSESA